MNNEIFEHLKILEPLKLEFIDDNDDYHQADSNIKAVYDDYIVVSVPVKNNITYAPSENSEINLIFAREDGVLIAQAMVLGVEQGIKSGIKLNYPYKARILQRREYHRVPAKLRVEVICHQDHTYIENKSFFAVTKNVSGSGIAFYHKEPVDNYYDITCKIYLNDGDPKPVVTKNDLIYSKQIKIKNEQYFLSAIMYKSISESDSARIIKECFRHQVKQKNVRKLN